MFIMHIIDFHTHIFPDKIAKQAVAALAEESGDYRPSTDGTRASLLASMDGAGIAKSVVANIATRPAQTLPILEFCRQVRGDRLAPLVSFHPGNSPDEAADVLFRAAGEGIRGVKLHPMYQEFAIDEKRMFPFYQMIEHYGFFVVFHTGLDVAFPGNLQADVERVAGLARAFPELTIVATHVGGWRQWDRAPMLAKHQNLYTETSMTLTEMGDDDFVRLLDRFDADRVLFGSDSPWTDQREMVERTRKLRLSDERKEKLLSRNAERLLGKTAAS
jgi:predicted TIM-barrel fold metal-dependent hydrolase